MAPNDPHQATGAMTQQAPGLDSSSFWPERGRF
ncbi:MAG: hypothetical protein ACI8TX_003291, partial [Hyphomicrobiaceae bacterium]